MTKYSEKLKDPRWQKLRLTVMNRDGFRCQVCLDDTLPLNVHHLSYKPKVDPWDYDQRDLITLCEYCHKQEHACKSDRLDELLALAKKYLTSIEIFDICQSIEDVSYIKEITNMETFPYLRCTAGEE